MSHSTDLRKLLGEEKPTAYSVWMPMGGAMQFTTDARVLTSNRADYVVEKLYSEATILKLLSRIDAALAEVVEPVAWLHEVTDGDEQSLALSFSPDSFPLDTLTGWKSISHRPLIYGDTAPASGVREGMIENLAMMLRRMIWQINKLDGDSSLKVLAGKADGLIAKYGLQGSPLRDDTRAADQVNAEGQASNVPSQLSGKGDGTPSGSKKETILNDSAPAHSAPPSARQPVARQGEHNGGDYDMKHSASQPDTVAVPRDQLEHWAEYWNGSANEKAMSNALEHILDEVDDLLRAAQEAK